MPRPKTRHEANLASGLRLLAACAAALGLLGVASANLYWSASATGPAGVHVLFGRDLPEPLGRCLWLAVKPGLLAAAAGTVWSLVRLARVWRAGPAAGLCAHCGYDLRATPDRCPECGAVPPNLAHPV